MKKQLITFAGNHLGDATRSANIFDFESNPTLGGNPYLVAASSDPGCLTSPSGWMKFTPQAEPGGVGATLVVQQTPGAAGYLPIVGLPSGVPSPGYYLDFVQSIPMIRLDNPRSLLIGVMGNLAVSTAFNIYASGADIFGQFMTVSQAVPAGLAAATYYDLLKSFAYVSRIRVSATTTSPIWVGVGPTFGMDYYTPDVSFINRATYALASLDISAPATVFNAPPALTAVPVATGNDVRGCISVFPAANYANITGTNPFTVSYVIEGATAQSGWTYDAPQNIWVHTPNSSRVLHTIGAAQYYNAAQA